MNLKVADWHFVLSSIHNSLHFWNNKLFDCCLFTRTKVLSCTMKKIQVAFQMVDIRLTWHQHEKSLVNVFVPVMKCQSWHWDVFVITIRSFSVIFFLWTFLLQTLKTIKENVSVNLYQTQPYRDFCPDLKIKESTMTKETWEKKLFFKVTRLQTKK